METNLEQILNIENKIKEVKQECIGKLQELELEKAKIEYPELDEFVQSHFTNSNIFFYEDRFRNNKLCILENNFGVKKFNIPLVIQFIDDKKAIVLGLKENNDDSKNELYKELNELTKDIFPIPMNICVVDDLFGEHKYGEIQDNKLNIKHVFLSEKIDIDNTITIFHKFNNYKSKCFYFNFLI